MLELKILPLKVLYNNLRKKSRKKIYVIENFI